jgi:hypothetical protein
MSDPVISPDGKFMWTGSEWIPAPPKPSSQSANVSLQDSVISGDVNTIINDTDTISSAVQSASKCQSCGSVGATQISCSLCNKLAYCSVCSEDVQSARLKLISSVDRDDFNQRWCDSCFKSTISDLQKCDGCNLLGKDVEPCFKCGEKRCGNFDWMGICTHKKIYSFDESDRDKRKQLSLHRLDEDETIYLCSDGLASETHLDWSLGINDEKRWSWSDIEFGEKMKELYPPISSHEDKGRKAWHLKCPKGHPNMLVDYAYNGLEKLIERKNPMKCKKVFCRKTIDLKSVNMKKAWPFE